MSTATGQFPIAALTPAMRKVAGPAAVVISAALLVKLAAMGKEFVVAAVFGRSDAMDAYIAAMLVPALLVNLAAESMSQALVPVLIRVCVQQGVECARELLATSFARLLILLLAASAGVAGTAPWWIRLLGWNFSPAKLTLTLHLFYGLTPFVLFAGIGAVCRAVLNSSHQYAVPELAQSLVPVSTGLACLLWGGKLGVSALVWATVAGAGLYAAVLVAILPRAGYAFRWRWNVPSYAGSGLLRQYGAVVLSSIVASGGLLVDQACASSLPAGSVSALAFAGRFVSLVLALASAAASAALGPHFATLVAQGGWRECREALDRWTRVAWVCGIASAVPLCFGARMLLRVLLQHGAFRAEDTAAVAPVLVLAALQIPFFAASRVHYRLLLAMGRADLILTCGALNLLLDVVLDFVLMRWLGVAGIALATTLWTISTWAFLAVCCKRQMASARGRAGIQL